MWRPASTFRCVLGEVLRIVSPRRLRRFSTRTPKSRRISWSRRGSCRASPPPCSRVASQATVQAGSAPTHNQANPPPKLGPFPARTGASARGGLKRSRVGWRGPGRAERRRPSHYKHPRPPIRREHVRGGIQPLNRRAPCSNNSQALLQAPRPPADHHHPRPCRRKNAKSRSMTVLRPSARALSTACRQIERR